MSLANAAQGNWEEIWGGLEAVNLADKVAVQSKEIAPVLVVYPAADRAPGSEPGMLVRYGFRLRVIDSAVEAVIANRPGFPTRVGIRQVAEFAAEADGDGVGSAGLLDSDFEIPILGATLRLSRWERVV